MSAPARSPRLDAFLSRPRRAVWTLALPIMAGMSIQTLYMLVDMVFVGRVGPDALTALAFNMPLVFMAIGVVFGLGSGVTAVIARAIGAEDKVGADRSAEHALGLGLVVAAVFTGVGLAAGREMLTALGVPPELLPLAWVYFRILAAGYVFLVLSVFFRSILAGEGDVRTPVAILGAGTLLNVALDPLFIFTFDMGVAGAALATIVSQALVTAIFVHLLFFRRHAYVSFDLRHFRFSGEILWRIVAIGAPASFSFVVMAVGGAVFNRILIAFSADAVAAYQVGQRLDHIFLLPVIALSASLVTLVGMFHGARRSDLVHEILGYATLRAVAVSLVVGGLFYVLAPRLVGMFSDAPEILEIGTRYLRIAVFGYPFVAVGMLHGRALQGLGMGVPVFVLTLMRVLLISAPLAVAGVFWLGRPVEWVWVSIVAGAVVTAFCALAWLRAGLRRANAADATLPGSGPEVMHATVSDLTP